jgi:hypothetical protein
MQFSSDDKVFDGEIEKIKRRIHAKYKDRIAKADFAEGIELTCEMNAEIDAAIDEYLDGKGPGSQPRWR